MSSFYTLDGGYVGSSYSGTAGCQLNVGPNGLPADYPASAYPNGYQFFPCPTASPTNDQGYAPKRAGYVIWTRMALALAALCAATLPLQACGGADPSARSAASGDKSGGKQVVNL